MKLDAEMPMAVPLPKNALHAPIVNWDGVHQYATYGRTQNAATTEFAKRNGQEVVVNGLGSFDCVYMF